MSLLGLDMRNCRVFVRAMLTTKSLKRSPCLKYVVLRLTHGNCALLVQCGDYDASLRILDSLSEETEASVQLRMATAYQMDDLQSTEKSLLNSLTTTIRLSLFVKSV